MKCKRHPYELCPGVCASCLRERLLAVVADQTAHPDPTLFPSSQSPHHRCDDSATPRCHLLFFSTPQVPPSFGASRWKRSLFSHPRSEEPDSNSLTGKRSGAIHWLSALIPGRRQTGKTKKTTKPVETAIRVCERDTVSEGGYSTGTCGTSPAAMPMPMPTPIRGRNQMRHGGGSRVARCS
ncbi:hypothetical protein J5N97_017346 [Dioscorea zingiberensis]|uniref:Uncharacterized protein n=1 Tax=Dioscorea zingiberensis TaxID=325984 RepID=A0A9D5CL05_9LILI|nr:hypothetical protein J5N97_017346 [Dioscorea zingiberensis]